MRQRLAERGFHKGGNVVTHFEHFNPASNQILWQGTPSDLTNVATGGRVSTGGYTLTGDALHFGSGVLTSREEMIPLWAIRDADVMQSITQKARGVADVRLIIDPQHRSSFGQPVVVLRSLRDARVARDMILRQANVVRQYWADHYQQRTVEANRAGASQVVIGTQAPMPTPALTEAQRQQAAIPSSSTDDLMAQLTKLGEMRTAGLLTDTEFTAAKARLLGT